MARRFAGSVVVDRAAEDLYRMWSQIQDLPRFLRHIKSAVPTGRSTSHWVQEPGMLATGLIAATTRGVPVALRLRVPAVA